MRHSFFAVACACAGVALASGSLRAQADTQAPAAAGQTSPTPARGGRGTPTPPAGRGGRGQATPGQARADTPTLDVAAIDRYLGKTGQALEDVYKISLPRSDLNVTVGDVKIKPGFALGGWAAFKLAPTGNQAVVNGVLVLTEVEVNPVISALQQHDFDITAVHNPLLHASPNVMAVHFWAEGSPASLAASLRDALDKTKTPLTNAATPPHPASEDLSAENVDKIQDAVGLKGAVNNGVLALSQPRPEVVQMMGVTLPPSMGTATSVNFQSAGGDTVAATGDFVMIADEVNRVARTLRSRDIEITSLHTHSMHGSPELYVMHFWAVGDPGKIGAGLKAALGQLKK